MIAPVPIRLVASVGPEHDGERLDRFLSRRFPDVSRARFQDVIANGGVSVEGVTVTVPRRKMRAGENVEARLPEASSPEPVGETIPLAIAYEDEDVIVIDKPAGLVVHPASGHDKGTLVNALIAHCGSSLSGIGGIRRPGIVHRLDKDTSGLMVVAKNDRAHQALARQFAAHGRDGRLKREYAAIVWGAPDRRGGVIDAPLGRSIADRRKVAVSNRPGSRRAITRYEVAETFGDPAVASLVRCGLETGRTHQIRAHMAHIGHPLLGDRTYGKGFSASAGRLSEAAQTALAGLGRQALHAVLLGFDHPASGVPLIFESELPADIDVLRRALRGTLYAEERIK
jgi:23S rRNA pseudouridine1911/1915/1917 synthase